MWFHAITPELNTGPRRLFYAIASYDHQLYTGERQELNETMAHMKFVSPGILFVNLGLIFPYDWHRSSGIGGFCSAQSEGFNAEKCKKVQDPNHESYSITYWSHSWADTEVLKKMADMPSNGA